MTSEDKLLAEQVQAYLLGGSICWGSRKGVERTAEDVLRLDGDLKAFVREAVMGRTSAVPEIRCGNITLDELLKVFNPIAAAIWVQWYREEPGRALASLCMRGGIEGLPKPSEKVTDKVVQRILRAKAVSADVTSEKIEPSEHGSVTLSQFGVARVKKNG